MCLKHIVLSGSDLDAKARHNATSAARVAIADSVTAAVDTAEAAAEVVTR